MTEGRLAKLALVTGTVVRHWEHRGLVVRLTDSDQQGFVDSVDLHDIPGQCEAWPPVGAQVRALVLGYTRVGQLRLTMRPRDIALNDWTSDALRALDIWKVISVAGPDDAKAVAEFYRSPDAEPLLRWAMRYPPHAAAHRLATKLFEGAPIAIKEALFEEFGD